MTSYFPLILSSASTKPGRIKQLAIKKNNTLFINGTLQDFTINLLYDIRTKGQCFIFSQYFEKLKLGL
jgi:hypothetical protein